MVFPEGGILVGRADQAGVVYFPDDGVRYFVNANFPVDMVAPLGSPYAADVGTLFLTQTDGQFSISGGRLIVPPQTTPLWGDLGFYAEKQGGGAIPRAAGRVYQYVFNATNLGVNVPFIFSWHNNTALGGASDTNSTGAVIFESGTFRILDGLSYFVLPTPLAIFSAGADEGGVMMLRSTGILHFKRTAGVNRLVWPGIFNNTANVYPVVKNYFGNFNIDYVRVRDVPLPNPTLDQTTPVSGTIYTGDANGTFDLVCTAPAVLANTIEMRFREQDASNYLALELDAAGAINMIKVVATVRSVLTSVAGVIAGGQTRRIRAQAVDNKLNMYTADTSSWTKRGAEITDVTFQTATGVSAVMGAGWTGANLGSWPVDSPQYNGVL